MPTKKTTVEKKEVIKKDSQEYIDAKKRVEDIKSFYSHLLVYILVIGFLFILDVITSSGTWWFYWPAFGWGIGLTFHGINVFSAGIFGKEWENKKIQKILNKSK